jgi:hypothetical protein
MPSTPLRDALVAGESGSEYPPTTPPPATVDSGELSLNFRTELNVLSAK